MPCIFCQKLLFHYSFFFNCLFLIKKEIEVSNEKNWSLLIGLTAPLLCWGGCYKTFSGVTWRFIYHHLETFPLGHRATHTHSNTHSDAHKRLQCRCHRSLVIDAIRFSICLKPCLSWSLGIWSQVGCNAHQWTSLKGTFWMFRSAVIAHVATWFGG